MYTDLKEEIVDEKVFVRHSTEKLPSKHQIGDKVNIVFSQETDSIEAYWLTGRILAVHFYSGKIKYDVEIPIADESPTRIYNLDSRFVINY